MTVIKLIRVNAVYPRLRSNLRSITIRMERLYVRLAAVSTKVWIRWLAESGIAAASGAFRW